MLIRNMEEKDLNDVAILYESLIEPKNNRKNMIEKFSSMRSNYNYILIVAEEDGKIVGTVMGIVCLTMVSNFNSFLVIEALIVDKEYRGHGISKQMLLDLEDRAKGLGCRYIILVSGKQRKEAHKLYEALGYGEDEAKGFRKFINDKTS
ncbi:GNAT family N-acetyltransferase [Desulfosporosinus sp. FKA]|uniref:GNAT family N-acetyltransferase n=1 Tax=Desulfosporosinus sp. FKA TaxID=1969834 RepID=UPI000B4A50DC|nr:GNAT family N-acetyltransferase [Desulfosporosinus sp. FKA]